MASGLRPPGQAASTWRARLAALLHGPDVRIAAVVLAVCAGLFAVTTTFDSVPEFLGQNIPATWFPRLLLAAIVLLTLILPVEHRFVDQGKQALDEDRQARVEPISLLTGGLLIAVVLSAVVLGTFLAMVLVCLLLPLLWGERPSWKLLLFTAAFPTVVTFVFTQLLQVYFDPGIFGSLLR